MVSFARDPQRRISIAKCQAIFLKMLPAIKRHAKISFRHLNAEAKEEAMQNVIANTWAALLGLARRGRLDKAFPTVLARFGVGRTKEFRIVGGHLAIKDVLSRYCQAKKKIVVERLDQYDDEEGKWCEVLVEDKTSGPADIAASRLDFAAWLRSLPSKLRKIAKFLANGETTSAAAKKFNVSAGRISQIRKELHREWKRIQGEDTSLAVA